MSVVSDVRELMCGNSPVGLSTGQFVSAFALCTLGPLAAFAFGASLHAYNTVPADEFSSSDHVGAKILTMLGIDKAPDLANGFSCAVFHDGGAELVSNGVVQDVQSIVLSSSGDECDVVISDPETGEQQFFTTRAVPSTEVLKFSM